MAWPLAGALMAGVAAGPWAGLAVGPLMGLARVGAAAADGVGDFHGERVLSIASPTVLYGLAGAVAGQVTTLLRRAERQISAARAREEIARTPPRWRAPDARHRRASDRRRGARTAGARAGT